MGIFHTNGHFGFDFVTILMKMGRRPAGSASHVRKLVVQSSPQSHSSSSGKRERIIRRRRRRRN